MSWQQKMDRSSDLWIRLNLFCNFYIMDEKEKLLEIVKVNSQKNTVRITIPRRIAKILDIGDGDFIGYYEAGRTIIIRKLQ